MANTRKSRRKLAGHYCWCCDRRRAHERFSGKGHRQHLCRDCARLGKDELAYRQAMRNLERLVTWEGIIPRKKRRQFQRFLKHDDTRIRAHAQHMLAIDAQQRAQLLLQDRTDDFAIEDTTNDVVAWGDALEAPW